MFKMCITKVKTIGEPIQISGLSGRWLELKFKKFKYDKYKMPKCPYCNGYGIRWAGWFSCENCSCVGVPEMDRAFIPVEEESAGG